MLREGVSQFEIYSFLLIMVSEAQTTLSLQRGAWASRTIPRMCTYHAASGNSTETPSFAGWQTASEAKMYGRELPEATWQRTHPRDGSACANPGFAGTRTGAQHDNPRHFRQTQTLPRIRPCQQSRVGTPLISKFKFLEESFFEKSKN